MVANDLTIYSDYAHEWWQDGSPRFRSLRNIAPLKLELIREWCGSVKGRKVYDLGCGGGFISVPLLLEGADLVGVDQSKESIEVARIAAKGVGKFIAGDICSLPFESESADIVLLADVLDHIPDFKMAIAEAARVLRPGGMLFASTLNRTFSSWFFCLALGETLRLIPPGTHKYSLFIRPEELEIEAKNYLLSQTNLAGEFPKIWSTLREWTISLRRSKSTSVGYSMCFKKAK